jgi:hypothetical protein
MSSQRKENRAVPGNESPEVIRTREIDSITECLTVHTQVLASAGLLMGMSAEECCIKTIENMKGDAK